MINMLDEYLNLQDEMFEKFDEYAPQMQKISKANEIGNKVLNFIDEEMSNFNEDAFNSIDIDNIIKKINVNKNEKIQGDILTEIYTEIEDTFKLGGRISLSEYILQGDVIYTDMQNELMGKVDYSIGYSEEELKKAEKQAFERFSMVMSLQNTKDSLINHFELTPEGDSLKNRIDKYLEILPENLKSKNIDEKISEINGLVLSVENLKSLDCTIKDVTGLNNFFSEKIKDLTVAINDYSQDKGVRLLFDELKENIYDFNQNSKDEYKELYSSLLDKLDIISENVLSNENFYDMNDRELN